MLLLHNTVRAVYCVYSQKLAWVRTLQVNTSISDWTGIPMKNLSSDIFGYKGKTQNQVSSSFWIAVTIFSAFHTMDFLFRLSENFQRNVGPYTIQVIVHKS